MNDMTDLGEDIAKRGEDRPPAVDVRGVARLIDGAVFAQVGGGNAFPCATVVGVADGDEVTVRFENHTAVITGNLGSPAVNASEGEKIMAVALRALAASGANHIEQTDRGLEIGNKDAQGNWVGTRLVASDDGVYVVSASNDVLAFYGDGSVVLGGDCFIDVIGIDDLGRRVMNMYAPGGLVLGTQNLGSAGSSMAGAVLTIDNDYIELSVIDTSSGGITGALNTISVEHDGIHINGNIYANGKRVEW